MYVAPYSEEPEYEPLRALTAHSFVQLRLRLRIWSSPGRSGKSCVWHCAQAAHTLSGGVAIALRAMLVHLARDDSVRHFFIGCGRRPRELARGSLDYP